MHSANILFFLLASLATADGNWFKTCGEEFELQAEGRTLVATCGNGNQYPGDPNKILSIKTALDLNNCFEFAPRGGIKHAPKGGFFNPPYGCGSCWKTGNNPKDTSITCSCPDPRGDNPSIRVNLKVDLNEPIVNRNGTLECFDNNGVPVEVNRAKGLDY